MQFTRLAPAPAGVIERWQPELDRLATPGESPTWLKLAWIPGYPWQPVERWFIYQMVPLKYMSAGPSEAVADYLRNGPDPAHCIGFNREANRLTVLNGIRPVVDRFQYGLYKETGYYAQPLWICQGFNGGHKRRFDETESSISQMHGGPEHPPAPGDLPYAEPDARTIAKLADLDLVRRYRDCVAFDERSPDQLDAEEKEQVKSMRVQLWNWLESQVAETLTFTREQLSEIKDTAVEGPALDYEKMEEQFITDR